MKRYFVLSIVTLLIVLLTATSALAQGAVFQVTLPGRGSPGFRFYFMYPSSISAVTKFEMTVNAQHIVGSGAATPFLRVTSEPSNLVFPLLPTSSEAPQYCNPNWCSFGWMTDVDQVSRIMRFQVGQAPGQQLLLLKVDASNGGGGPWVYVTDITITMGPIVLPSLSVVASPQTIEANKPSTVTVIVSGLSQGDTAMVALSGPGVSQTQTTSGSTSFQVTPTGQGSIMISATASGYQSGTTSIVVTRPITTLSVTVSPPEVEANKATSITITVNGLYPGDTATITLSGAGVGQTVTANGPSAQVQISPTGEGTVQVAANAPGYQPGSASITVKPGFPWLLLAAVLIAAVIAIGVVAVFLLTRKKPAPSAGYKPYYPTAPAAPMLKPGAPQAVKPAAHRPMVIARREEEKK